MSAAKIAISLDLTLVKKIDGYVKNHLFKSRSQAIQLAVAERIERMERGRLKRECAKLNPKFEQQIADEFSLKDDTEWPEY